MTFDKIQSFGSNIWNYNRSITTESLEQGLNIVSKVSMMAICIIPNSYLPSTIFPIISVIDALKDVMPACIKVLSKDQSIKTIAKCAGLTALALTPLAIQFSPKPQSPIQPDPVRQETFTKYNIIRDKVCSKGSETEQVFQELISCINENNSILSCTKSSNPSFSYRVRVTQELHRGVQSVLSFFKGEAAVFRFTPEYYTATSLQTGGYLKVEMQSNPFKTKSIDLNELRIDIDVWAKSDITGKLEGCHYASLLPRYKDIGETPYCLVTVSKITQYITCLSSKIESFTLADSYIQRSTNPSAPVLSQPYSYEEIYPCKNTLLSSKTCKNIEEPPRFRYEREKGLIEY